MPVHRHVHDKLGSVFAFRSELDEWWQSRAHSEPPGAAESDDPAANAEPVERAPQIEPPRIEPAARRFARPNPRRLAAAISLAAVAAAAGAAWVALQQDLFWRSPLAAARFIPSTAFAENAQAAAISRDGRFVAVLAERDGRTDAWVSEFGSDNYRNVTGGALRDLVNPAVRTLGFSMDSSLVSIWTRLPDGSRPDDVSVWAAPTEGGALQPYLRNVAELDWSPDGERMVYHTTAPGDPLFVREPGARPEDTDREIYAAPAGVHDHFPTWSPDGAFIYFVRGVPPDHWDIWRIRPSGAELERITEHDTFVAYPVMLDRRTLVYLATDADGSGPWIYAVDVERRIPHRISLGLETYTSLGASQDGGRLVATVAHRHTSLWRMSLAAGDAAPSTGEPTLLVADGNSPRMGRGFVLFAASRGDRQGIWTVANGTPRELWSGAQYRIVGAPAIAPDGQRIAFTAAAGSKSELRVMDEDGANPRVLTDALALRGSPVWWPDGESIVSAALREGEPQLMRIFLNGAPPVVLVSDYAVDPVWSPDGRFLVYSGADVGTTFPLRAAEADGRPHPLPGLMLTRGARRVAFLNDRPSLVYLRGELAHKDLWLLDLQSGEQRELAKLPPDFVVGDFDVSADGTDIVLDRIEEDSALALIERRQ
jgi:Tol biopolymer transport system component